MIAAKYSVFKKKFLCGRCYKKIRFLAAATYTITGGRWAPLKVFFVVQLSDRFLLPMAGTAATKYNSGAQWPPLKVVFLVVSVLSLLGASLTNFFRLPLY